MNVLEQVSLAFQVLLRTARLIPRPALWMPWLVLGAAQLLALALLWGFAHPAVSWLMAPLLARAAGPEVLRYPNLLRTLPELFSRADLVISMLLGPIVIGAATLLFAQHLSGGRPRPAAALLGSGRRAIALIVAQLPFNLVAIGLLVGPGEWLLRHGGPRSRLLLSLALVAGSVAVRSLLPYVAALVMLEGRGGLRAIRELPGAWARGFWSASVLGLVPLAALLPLRVLSGRAGTLVDHGDPERVVWLVAAQILISLAVWFMLTGSATLVYLVVMARPDSESR